MKKRIALMLAIVLVLIVSLSLPACGNIAEKVVGKAVEKAVESAAGGNVDINTEDGEVNISTDQGEVQSGGNATIPEGWPTEAPPYPDIKITYSAKTKNDNGTTGFALFAEVSKGTVKDVYDWYKSKMSGWETSEDNFSTTDGNDSFGLSLKNNKYEALIMAGSDGTVINFTMSIVESSGE